MKLRENLRISRSQYDAVVFDLDGVITETAKVHARAWKEMFDQYLRERSRRQREPFQPFNRSEDYTRYVDGKPRYEGVKSFLRSRGIELPEGSPDDPPGKETVCGLGNRKNQLFHKCLGSDQIQVYESSVQWIINLRAAGYRTAVVSSSKNCRQILREAGVEELFEVRLDGVDAEEIGLEGKPAPDIFLEAARRLGVDTDRTAVVEDATAGVEAARRGGFKLVIGVDRADQADRLRETGADYVVKDLSEIPIEPRRTQANASDLPSALEHLGDIGVLIKRRKAAVFLDYDGTLTPIVRRPEDAHLPDLTRKSVEHLARHCTVAVVSGRDLPDLRQRVGLDKIIYAGSHGFDIQGPDGLELQNQEGVRFLPLLDRAEQRLREVVSSVPGTQVERKKFSIAVHYRRVDPGRAGEVASHVNEVAAQFEGLERSEGKKVFELQPKVDWHKGRAVLWLLEALGLNHEGVLPIYIGDDTTDENAFRSLQNRGLGIVVEEGSRMTSAQYVLRDPDEVRQFIDRLATVLQGEHA